MTDTVNLGLPCIEAAQAQKHVTHNEALRIIDTLLHLAIITRTLNVPPGGPAEGQRWIVKAAPAPTGAWAGHGNHVAAWQDGAWQFSVPKTGWLAYILDETLLAAWNGAAWVNALAAFQNIPMVGINTAADAANRLAVKSDAILFSHDDVTPGTGDHRIKVNKSAAGKTASYLFQDNFSGRAEVGLTGDDDFHFKVSPNGSTWLESLLIDRTTGKVSFPQGAAGIREVLTANRTYYVRTDGNDANTGLVNSAGGAFLTIQKALDVAFGTIDLAGFNVTIQVADGTYTGLNVARAPQVGFGKISVKGNAATPANVLISVAGGAADPAFRADDGAILYVEDLKIQTTSGDCLWAQRQASILFANLVFGPCAGWHIRAGDGGTATANGNFTVAGNAMACVRSGTGGVVRVQSRTVTLTGTPAFSGAFAQSLIGGMTVINGNTFSGAATGVRYDSQSNSVIFTGGGGPTALPGDAAGTTATGGQYI
jgi:hypothetical protein